MASDVSIRVGVDGANEFKTAIRSINGQMRTLDSEMRALVSGIDNLDDAEAAAGQRMGILQRQMQLTEQRIQTLTAEYDRQTAKLEELGRAQEEAMRSGTEADITRTTNAFNRQQQVVNNLSRQLNNAQADMNRFESDMRAVENGTDRLTNSFRDAGNAADDMGSGLANAFTAGAVSGAVQSLISGIGGFIESTNEMQVGMSRLEQNAKSAGIGIDFATEAFTKFNAISGETDSSIEAVSNLLQTGFDENGLTQAVEALSGAVIQFPDTLNIESLADGLQETLATGAATGQFAELLDRVGIGAENFSDKLAQCTTDAEKQNLVLETLASAGLNDVYNEYQKSNGPMMQYREALTQIQTSMAEVANIILPVVVPAVQAFASALDELQPVIQFIVDNIEPLTGAIVGFGAALAGVKIVGIISELGGLGGAIAKVGSTILGIVGGPVGLAITAIAAAVGAIITLWNTNEGFREGVISVWEGIQQVVSVAVEAVKAVISTLIEFFAGVVENIKTVWSGITEFFSTLWTNIVTTIQTVWSNIVTFFATIAEGVKAVWNGVTEFFTMIFTNAVTAVQTVWGGIVAFFTTIWTGIQTVFSAVVEFFSGIFSGAVTAIQSAWSGVTAFFSSIWAGIQSIFSVVASVLGGFFRSAASAVQSAWNGVTSFFSGIWGKIKGVFSDAISAFSRIGRNIVDGIKNGISNAWNSLVSWVRGKFEGLVDSVLGFLGIHSPSRVFAEIGEDSMAGYAQGVEDDKSAEKALTDQMRSIISTAVNLSDQLNNKLIAKENELTEKLKDTGLDEATKESLNSQLTAVKEFRSEYESAMQQIEQSQESMANKLRDYGDLFESVKTESGESIIEIGDLQADIDAINAYGDALERLQARGVSGGLMDEITNLNVDDAIAYTDRLLNMTDDQYEKYMQLWEQKQEAAEEVARKFYQDEMDAMTEEFVDRIPGELSGLKDDMRTIGVNSIQGLINGIQSMSGMLSDAARQVISDALSAMRSEADIHSPSKKTENLIGKPLAQGIEVGFLDQLASVKNIMASAIMAPFSRITTNDLYGATAGMVNGMAAAAPVGGMTSTVVIPVNLNGKKIAEVIYDPLKQVGKQRGY